MIVTSFGEKGHIGEWSFVSVVYVPQWLRTSYELVDNSQWHIYVRQVLDGHTKTVQDSLLSTSFEDVISRWNTLLSFIYGGNVKINFFLVTA